METRVTGDEAQRTMGKRKNQRRPFSPSRLPLRPNVHRDIETCGGEAAFENVAEIVVIS